MNDPVARPAIPDFELVRIVGRGSYGDVWLARSITGAWRAIKIVWRDRFTNVEPFEREFRGLKEFADVCLGESSQMTLLHVGRNDAAGFFYYVMELADDADRGRDIDPSTYVPLTLAELRTRRGRISADECARFGAEVARCLASLHRRGLVHRDVKPSNIILVSGVPKLADVGLVAPSASARTFVGTEGYVPPEGPGAPSADVFALGKVLYELSTGHDRQEFPKLPAGLGRLPDRAALLELNEIFLRACGPTASGRYRDGAAILADLTALNAGVSLRTRRFAALVLRTAAVSVVVAALGLGVWKGKALLNPEPPPVAPGIFATSVAVLPFTDASGDPAQEYFAEGISDEISHALEGRELRVTGSRSSFSCKDQKLPKSEIIQRLGVAYLIEGSLQRTGPQLRLDVWLTRGADGVTQRIGTFARARKDVFTLEAEAARAVEKKILGRVTMPASLPPTESLEAYEAFLHGRTTQVRVVLDSQSQPTPSAATAVEHFERAVALDPYFALAWTRLAEARFRMPADGNSRSSARAPSPILARQAVERALELRPQFPLALGVRGFIRARGQKNVENGGYLPKEAREEIAQGLADLGSAEELGGANAETLMARFLVRWFVAESLDLLPLAHEALTRDPENLERLRIVIPAMRCFGDYAEVDRLCQQAIARGSAGGTGYPAADRVYNRQAWRGTAAALQLAEVIPDQPGVLGARVHMLVALGRTAEAAKLLTDTNPKGAFWGWYAEAGLTDQARELATVRLPQIQSEFEEAKRKRYIDRDNARVALISREILFDQHESALAHMEEWREELEGRTQNRRSGGLVPYLPTYYVALGKPEIAIALLQRAVGDGMRLGYELSDPLCYGSLQNDPRFQVLQRQAEAWAASQPDPEKSPASHRK